MTLTSSLTFEHQFTDVDWSRASFEHPRKCLLRVAQRNVEIAREEIAGSERNDAKFGPACIGSESFYDRPNSAVAARGNDHRAPRVDGVSRGILPRTLYRRREPVHRVGGETRLAHRLGERCAQLDFLDL